MSQREILFRGKRLGDGEWVEGYYFAKPILSKHFIELGNEQWMVNPSTVGQYIGQKDKNGVQIFEGDVLRGFRYRDHRQWGENEVCTYTVRWDDKKAAFYPLYFFDGYTFNIETFEVVGNIHDNPELLEEGTE